MIQDKHAFVLIRHLFQHKQNDLFIISFAVSQDINFSPIS